MLGSCSTRDGDGVCDCVDPDVLVTIRLFSVVEACWRELPSSVTVIQVPLSPEVESVRSATAVGSLPVGSTRV